MRRSGLPGYRGRAGERKTRRRLLCALMAILLLAGAAGSAAAESMMGSTELLIAESVLQKLGITAEDGNPVHARWDMGNRGRGQPGPDGKTPDYIGQIGYAVPANDWDLSRQPFVLDGSWGIPGYREGEERMVRITMIGHKTPVVVLNQELYADEEGHYAKYLEIIRLDTSEICWMNIRNFTAVPYWQFTAEECAEYGYGLAVFREASRYAPRTVSREIVSPRDGTRVLIPPTELINYVNPDPANLQIAGVMIEVVGKTIRRRIVFFNRDDLTLFY